MTIDLFIPCFIDQMYPDTAWNTLKILEKAGCKVNYNPRQTCCGQPLFNSGDVIHAQKLAIKFTSDFATVNPIVVPSASCAGYIKKHYGELLKGTSHEKETERIQSNIFELSDFLVNHLNIHDVGATFQHKVTYHDACSALREYGLKEEPRKLLANVKGLELIEMDKNEECCGFGGTFMVKHPAISSAMTEQKVQNALATKSEYIVSTEASCLMNIQSYINKHKLKLKTIHLADVLASDE